MSAGRPPDTLDAARVLALALLAVAGIGALEGLGVPSAVRSALLQASFLAVPLGYARAAGLRPLDASGFGRPRLRDLLLTAAASMASLWLLKALADLQIDLFSSYGTDVVVREEAEKIDRTVRHARNVGGLAGLSLFVIVPPLCEETLFRGILLRGFVRGFGPVRALVYTALLFAAMHGTLVQLLLMTFLGLYFGALSWLTRNVWPAVFAHAVNNAAVLALQLRYGPEVQEYRAPWPILVLSAAVFAGVLLFFWLDRRSRAITEPTGAS